MLTGERLNRAWSSPFLKQRLKVHRIGHSGNRLAGPPIQEMRALAGYRNKRAEFKKPYFVVPSQGVSFCTIPTALLESKVWSALGIYEIRFVTAILIAHARAGGHQNGRLVLTHEQLKARHIRGDRIRTTIGELVSLGLLEVTHKGGPADPSRYRVTFLPHIEQVNGKITYFPPGNDWIEIEHEIIEGTRKARATRHEPPARKTKFQRSMSAPISGSRCAPVDGTESVAEESIQVIEKAEESATHQTRPSSIRTRSVR
jgi:hypothetical protein